MLFLRRKSLLFGGIVSKNSVEERRKEDFVEWTQNTSFYLNNDLHQYDPNSNSFTRLSTTGKRFSPRSNFGIATLGNRVYVHGGFCDSVLNDFLMLDMSDMNRLQWTEIRDSGFPREIYGHSLSPISSTQLLLVGGREWTGISNKVRIFVAEKSEWKDEAPLPAEFVGRGGGLTHHRAVELRDGNSAFLICLGGFIPSFQLDPHSNHIAVFDIAY